MHKHLDDRPLVTFEWHRASAGVFLADALDRYDLMRAIRECDHAIEALQQTRAVHTANLCRIANRLAFAADAPTSAPDAR